MKTWVPRYEQIAHLSPNEKLLFYNHGRWVIDRIAFAGLMAWIFVAGLAFGLSADSWPEWLSLLVLFSPVVVMFYFIAVNQSALNYGVRRILSEKWHEIPALSALIEFANMQRGRGVYPFRSWAIDNLKLVLPLLRENDYAALSVRERRKLYVLIKMDAYPDFLLAAIETLRVFADVEALPVIRQLAEASALTPLQREVQQWAQQCAVFLEARVQEKTLEQSLLRGSVSNADTSHILLRAAEEHPTSETERHELLRANVQQ